MEVVLRVIAKQRDLVYKPLVVPVAPIEIDSAERAPLRTGLDSLLKSFIFKNLKINNNGES